MKSLIHVVEDASYVVTRKRGHISIEKKPSKMEVDELKRHRLSRKGDDHTMSIR